MTAHEHSTSTPSDTFSELLSLMELRPGRTPRVEVNGKSAPRRVIRNLLGRGAIPTYQNAPEDLRWLVEGEEPLRDQLDSVGVLDLLGEYQSVSKKVILYDLLIRLCAEKLGLDYQTLYDIVLCHELSHAASHLGVDQTEQEWTCFGAVPAEITEYFAQIYTHLLHAKKNRQDITGAMQRLASDQPALYSSYIKDANKDIADVNASLLIARQQIPPGMELLPEALSSQWSISFTNLRKFRNPHYVEPRFRGFPHIDVIWWDNEKFPWDKQWLTSGTEVNIAGEIIKVRSYDYSPSGDKLSPRAVHELYKLLVAQWECLRSCAFQSTEKGHVHFRVALASQTLQVDAGKPIVEAFWKNVCRIIGGDYPVLARVLLSYEGELRGDGNSA